MGPARAEAGPAVSAWPIDPAAHPGLRTLLIGLGAQKTGSSWLFRMLDRHPDCRFGPVKEVRFWDWRVDPRTDRLAARQTRAGLAETARARRDLARPWRIPGAIRRERDLRAYADLLARAGAPDADAAYGAFVMRGHRGEAVVCDMTPNYSLLEAEDFARMARLAPDVRFLFVMRDPVARLWSGTMHSHRGAIEDGRMDDEALLEAFRESARDPAHVNRRRGDYRRTIEALEAAVPRGRILYLFYETLFEAPAMDALARFLGVRPIAADPQLRVNARRRENLAPAAADLRAARRALAPVYDYVRERFGTAVPEAWAT